MENKTQLINIICEELQTDKDFIDSFSRKHTLLIIGEGDPVEITRGRVIPRPDISTSHEEADNIIIQQTFMAVEQGAECLSVMADDSFVYILLLHYQVCEAGEGIIGHRGIRFVCVCLSSNSSQPIGPIITKIHIWVL